MEKLEARHVAASTNLAKALTEIRKLVEAMEQSVGERLESLHSELQVIEEQFDTVNDRTDGQSEQIGTLGATLTETFDRQLTQTERALGGFQEACRKRLRYLGERIDGTSKSLREELTRRLREIALWLEGAAAPEAAPSENSAKWFTRREQRLASLEMRSAELGETLDRFLSAGRDLSRSLSQAEQSQAEQRRADQRRADQRRAEQRPLDPEVFDSQIE